MYLYYFTLSKSTGIALTWKVIGVQYFWLRIPPPSSASQAQRKPQQRRRNDVPLRILRSRKSLGRLVQLENPHFVPQYIPHRGSMSLTLFARYALRVTTREKASGYPEPDEPRGQHTVTVDSARTTGTRVHTEIHTHE
jgi:hypothetical protein